MRYQPNQAVLHTDASLMPRRRRAWASWNFHLADAAGGRTAVTYWMNNLQRLDCRARLLRHPQPPRADRPRAGDRDDRATPTRVITHASVAAQRRWGEISGRDRIHYCGAYWRWGFHEDGCWSAIRACESLLAGERDAARVARALWSSRHDRIGAL